MLYTYRMIYFFWRKKMIKVKLIRFQIKKKKTIINEITLYW